MNSRERTDRTPLAYLFLGGARHVLGLLSDFIADPPFVEALFDRLTEGTASYLRAILRTGACDAILFESGATHCWASPRQARAGQPTRT